MIQSMGSAMTRAEPNVAESTYVPPVDIEERTYKFALRVVRLCQSLCQMPGPPRTLGNQLLRAGTSVGANVEEARAAYSKAEFTCKMAISLKESRETRYWIRLLMDSQMIDSATGEPLLDEATQIMKILGAITSKARRNPD
jgi:four helix bundle protein